MQGGVQGLTYLSPKKVRQTLGVTEPVLRALVKSGLLGYTTGGMVSNRAVSSYEWFGTQWSIDERYGSGTRMIGEDVYEGLPPIEGIGPQPPSTQTHMRISPANNIHGAEETDTGWIAHFYLVPNYFYFPNPTELSLIGPPPLKLSEPKPIPGAVLPVTLYPHPSGYLGLVVVEGLQRPLEDAHNEAYDVAIPLLDELSTRYDVPLPVAQSIVVGVPSGVIHAYFAHRPPAKEIASEAEILPRCPHSELRDAYALYREAVSSNNPFHAFLAFWKVYEEAVYVRNGWGAKHKRSDTKVREEVFPDQFAFGARPEELGTPTDDPETLHEMHERQLRGSKFEKARELLRGPYRAALAHAGQVDVGKPLTGAYYDDYQKVADKVTIVRYMANVTLENVRATFDAQAQRDDGDTQEQEDAG